MKITTCSAVLLKSPLGPILNDLISVNTEDGKELLYSVVRSYIHDFVHCVYMTGNDKEFKVC